MELFDALTDVLQIALIIWAVLQVRGGNDLNLTADLLVAFIEENSGDLDLENINLTELSELIRPAGFKLSEAELAVIAPLVKSRLFRQKA